jgi:hypothetical protein
MSLHDPSILSAEEAAKIATNAYFSLNNWINHNPSKGAAENMAILNNRVLGVNPTQSSHAKGRHENTSLHTNNFKNAHINCTHQARTGNNIESGFGYTLTFNKNGQSHAVIAVRGTRIEMAGMPDLMTDFHASYTSFDDYGNVHTGFKNTFDSMWTNIVANGGMDVINKADVIHCVGHSLGGAVATLFAARLCQAHSNVKLYTFGSPRVGYLWTSSIMETAIGEKNIFRVAHDLDLISLIGPYPFTHVLSSLGGNNFTLASPKRIIGIGNHDMVEYIKHTTDGRSWSELKGKAASVRHEDALLARMLFGCSNAGGFGNWIQRGCRATLSVLLKLIGNYLDKFFIGIIAGLTGIDKLCALIHAGGNALKQLPSRVKQILSFLASWAGVHISAGANYTASIIKSIINKILAAMRSGAKEEISRPNSAQTGVPIDLDITDSRAV